jgi:nucleoid DNA-binding protein
VDELIALVSKKAKIDEKSAKVAVDAVLEFIKDKLPEPYASQLDNIVESGQADDTISGLGGLLGKK